LSDIPTELSAILTDRYRIQRQLGQGGMATVYLADDIKLERQVALKVLRPELAAVLGTERFLAEVKITARLDHPHILTLIDSGVAEGHLYYVLPFVRGESLRDLLDREQQLGIEQALEITKHIASALDYAHRQGVVHRDIKPENILLQEGEAMLADFGIALAVKEAGGNRLTETGLSLGTPQYMSPEQATGDRDLDARSDVYSLAAVLYEMLTGDPPITGKTVQAVIAKLLTEQPTHIRTVRSTVSDGIDAAVVKALSKVPADRFTSAGEFVRALEAGPALQSAALAQSAAHAAAQGTSPAAARRSRNRVFAVGGVAVAIVGVLAFLTATGRFSRADTSAALRERTQLTFSGKVSAPTLSSDGKQLAYFTKECVEARCTYAIDVQDVGSTVTRRVVEGVTAGYYLEWSPDRRNLIFFGTIGGHYGSHLVSALGGPPRFLTAGAATFFAGGDSLLLGPSGPSDSGFTVLVGGIGGGVHDSIRVAGAGQALATLISVPGTSRIVAMIIQPPRGFWQVLDRDGKVTDKLLNSCTCGGAASRDALWMTRAGPTVSEAVVRVALDPVTGRLASHQDTIYSGRFTNLSVTSDGVQMAVDDGSYSYAAQTADLPALLRGVQPTGAPLLQASSPVSAMVSPDGARLLLRRSLPGADGLDEQRYAVTPYAGGAETPISVPGRVLGAYWSDSVTVVIGALGSAGSRYSQVDVRTGTVGRTLELPDSAGANTTPLPNGWAWVPSTRDRIIVEQDGRRSEIPKPKRFSVLNGVDASPDGSHLLYTGWAASSDDTLGVEVVPTNGGASTPWLRTSAEGGGALWLADGSVGFLQWTGPESVTLWKATAPGQVQRLGTIPHLTNRLSVSGDLKRAVLGWSDNRGDAWMYRVVKP
jgi:tRNA A-37 threonylcarbamoyl transferase component Bud32